MSYEESVGFANLLILGVVCLGGLFLVIFNGGPFWPGDDQ